VPPFTVADESVKSTSGGVELAGGLTVSARFAALAPYAADSDTGVEVAADLLVTNANDAVVEPVNAVTFAGSDVNSSG
jgi:hypothetical protein